ncbi:MAG: TenA family transcriptional regulator [Myxococcota bacterium]
MRSARRIAPALLPKDEPPAGALFWRLWDKARPIAEDALATPFVQGIAAGTLDPVVYGAFNISDAYYCFHGADDYAAVAARAEDAPLRTFLEHKHQTYASYNATFPETWRVRDGDSLVPTPTCIDYAGFESQVARERPPIYSLVAMLPCEYLWAWLAAQLAPAGEGNLYAPWITDNDDPHGAYQMGNYLEDFAARHPGELDESEAESIYLQAMSYERDNFASALAAKSGA